jgi:hypothetical protein
MELFLLAGLVLVVAAIAVYYVRSKRLKASATVAWEGLVSEHYFPEAKSTEETVLVFSSTLPLSDFPRLPSEPPQHG